MDSEPRRRSEKRIGLIAASIACLASLGLALWTFWPSGGNRAVPSPAVANADTVALESSAPKAADTQRMLEGSDASEFIERSMDGAELEALDLTPVEKRRIARLATDRLSLFLAPSREAYLAHLESTLGAAAAESASEEQIEDYLRKASGFAGAHLDLDAAVTRPRFIAGVPVNPLTSGRTMYNRGHRPYTNIADPEEDEADVVDVLIPIVVTEVLEPHEEGKVYLVLSFVRDPDLGGWRPWRHSVYDPASRLGVLPPPWM